MSLEERLQELKKDLLHPDGPRVSRMGNYPFAIFQYDPVEEFEMRQHISGLISELRRNGWSVRHISLMKLLLDRLKNDADPNAVTNIVATEKRMFERHRDRDIPEAIQRILEYLNEKVQIDLEGPDGLARNVIETIQAQCESEPAERTLILISRAGALYPFYRTSGLLKYLDGNTFSAFVILLYPGQRIGKSRLKFMGQTAPESDYRPTIY
jgi:hypothetical protein